MHVTEPTTRLLQTFSLPSFDFTPEEARLVKGAAVTAALVLWFAAALIDAWFLLVVPVLAGLCAAAIWRLRQNRPESDVPEDDWSF
jgi:CHASE2 domain-containing sensor protein